MNDVVVIFAKEKPGLNDALAYLEATACEFYVFKGNVGDKFPKEAIEIAPDITISYISPWIIPADMLNSTKKLSINFHPGPPEYPGIGCTNFAIYEKAKEFGTTAHIMAEKVDTGRIISVKRFPICKHDSVYSLTQRCYHHILIQFYEIIDSIFHNKIFPKCDEVWTREPFTRKQLNELCHITNEMSNNEIKKRIKATYYPNMPGAYIELAGSRFEYKQ